MLRIIKSTLLLTLLFIGISFLSNRTEILRNLDPSIQSIKNKFPQIVELFEKTINKNHFNISEIMTYVVIIIGIVFIILHLVEFLAKSISRLFSREHTSHKSKQKVGKIFIFTVWVKISLLLLQVILLVTQAWSLSRFFHYLIDKPRDFWDIISKDALFIGILLMLLLVKTVSKENNSNKDILCSN